MDALRTNCTGCRNGRHEPMRLYPCLTDREWKARAAIEAIAAAGRAINALAQPVSPWVQRAQEKRLPVKEHAR